VLAGAYDSYGRGRVSNFLRNFNLLNMYLDIDGRRIERSNTSNMKQTLDMRGASFTTTFDHGDKASVTYTYYSLRHLPFTVLMDVTVTPKKDITITGSSVMEAPDALRDVQNYYNEIDRPHVVISLLTSSAKSPTGKLLMCASNTFLFSEHHGEEPRVIHEMWDNNMHLMKFAKKLRAGQAYRFSIAGSSITSAHHDDPLKEVSDPKAVQRDLEYYETRVPNEGTPAMTQGVFALLWARLGNRDKALHWFRDAYIPNLNPPFRVIAETKGGTNPYFATGAGGILQAVIMGFGGLEITPNGLTQIKTVLPKGWTGLTLTGVGPQKKTYTNK
jgi:trehalose/maltose hydrolase-like predicted phosphorylase